VPVTSADKPRESERAIGAFGRLRAAAATPVILAALGDRDLIWSAQVAVTKISRLEHHAEGPRRAAHADGRTRASLQPDPRALRDGARPDRRFPARTIR
jgi:hypothetical protein